ncbi:hypothetical protein BJY00DRAFT_58908 [Aspergillus carlsbadensis]|nr:hypothetical protein BJY00DRAFT_58908 [Aspergillus carlsbadensis]
MARSPVTDMFAEMWRISSSMAVIWLPNHEEFILLWKENTFNPLMLECLLNPEIMYVACRIRKYVVNGDAREASRLKDAYKDTLTMEAVAAAIIAQIAITMLSLPNFDSVHWAATAVAYSSLVCGILATFLAFIVQQILSDLHNAEEVRSWLTTTQRSYRLRQILYPQPPDTNATGHRIPSLRSAVILTTPSKLLRLSIAAAFIALGIYLGCVWDAELGNLKGRDANLGVLLVFIIVSFVMLQDALLPYSMVSYSSSRSTDEEVQDPSGGASSPRLGGGSTNGVMVGADDLMRKALESSIRAQEESLKAQRALLGLLDGQPSGTTPVTAVPRVLLH